MLDTLCIKVGEMSLGTRECLHDYMGVDEVHSSLYPGYESSWFFFFFFFFRVNFPSLPLVCLVEVFSWQYARKTCTVVVVQT